MLIKCFTICILNLKSFAGQTSKNIPRRQNVSLEMCMCVQISKVLNLCMSVLTLKTSQYDSPRATREALQKESKDAYTLSWQCPPTPNNDAQQFHLHPINWGNSSTLRNKIKRSQSAYLVETRWAVPPQRPRYLDFVGGTYDCDIQTIMQRLN